MPAGPHRAARGPRTSETLRRATDPMLRVVSSGESAVTVTPSASASTTMASSPAANTSTEASGAPSTAGLSPVTTRSDPTRMPPDSPSAPTVEPSDSPGRSWVRRESGAQRSITTAAATVGRKGPGHSSRPCASSTTASSERPNPEPPYSSGMASPCQPSCAAADQISAGWVDPPESGSSVARAASRLFSRPN